MKLSVGMLIPFFFSTDLLHGSYFEIHLENCFYKTFLVGYFRKHLCENCFDINFPDYYFRLQLTEFYYSSIRAKDLLLFVHRLSCAVLY